MSRSYWLTGSHRENSSLRFSFSTFGKVGKIFRTHQCTASLLPLQVWEFIHSLTHQYLSITHYMQNSGSAQTLHCRTWPWLGGLWFFLILSLHTHFCRTETWYPPPSVTLTCSPLTSEIWWVAWGLRGYQGPLQSWTPHGPWKNHSLSSSSHICKVPSLPTGLHDTPWKTVFPSRWRVRTRAVWGRECRIIAESTGRWLSWRLGSALSSSGTPGKPPPLHKASVFSSVKLA